MKPFNQFTQIQKQLPNNIIYWMARLSSYICIREIWKILYHYHCIILLNCHENNWYLQRYNRTSTRPLIVKPILFIYYQSYKDSIDASTVKIERELLEIWQNMSSVVLLYSKMHEKYTLRHFDCNFCSKRFQALSISLGETSDSVLHDTVLERAVEASQRRDIATWIVY